MSITIELEDGKRSMLILRNAAGMMVHLQFVDDVNEEVVQLDREGFKEKNVHRPVSEALEGHPKETSPSQT